MKEQCYKCENKWIARPEDGWCYMFAEYLGDCKQHKPLPKGIITWPKCKGEGVYAEHDLPENHGDDGECISCPVPVQCELCQTTGFVIKHLVCHEEGCFNPVHNDISEFCYLHKPQEDANEK